MTLSLNELPLKCRRIFLRDFVVDTRIGAHDFEKSGPQRVIFNVDLYVLLEDTVPTNDDLSEVVDYDFVREAIFRRVSQGHVQLQETLCDDIAKVLLAHPRVQAIRLSSCKPDVYPDCAGVGVETFQLKSQM